jgi:nucleoside 2-deoxyribosyltransferase
MVFVHVAASFENRVVARRIMRQLEAADFSISLDWTGYENARQLDQKRARQETFARADMLVIVLPAGRSSHVELGMAIAMGKPVVIYAVDPKILDNEKDGRRCSYYAHPAVRITHDEKSIVDLVRWRAPRGDAA